MSAVFYQIFIFHQMIALQKLWECFLFHLKSSFRSRDIQVFIFPSSPLFLPVSHCFRGWSKINVKVYDVINCLIKNLNKRFCLIFWEGKKVWYWNVVHWQNIKSGTFLWKNHAENVHQKLVPDPFLILVNSPKQPKTCKKFF